MIVDGAWYVEAERSLESDSIEKLAAERGAAGFGWLGLRMPTDDELDTVRDAFDSPSWRSPTPGTSMTGRRSSVTRTACSPCSRPPATSTIREVVEFGELFFYAGRDYLVSVRYGQAAPLAGCAPNSSASPELLAPRPRRRAPGRPAARRRSYGPVVDGLEHDVREVERDVFSESRMSRHGASTSSSARCSTSSSPSSRCRRR